jgi:hypothetical protein
MNTQTTFIKVILSSGLAEEAGISASDLADAVEKEIAQRYPSAKRYIGWEDRASCFDHEIDVRDEIDDMPIDTLKDEIIEIIDECSAKLQEAQS